ncbi:MAG: SpoIIE family protein phosphatase [Candidatus Riflebacteria bacterium]|nr:SpoIIE family protein phosphatase [Candidatus Riflebacteria bacterium]
MEPSDICRLIGLTDLFSIPWARHLLGSTGEGLVVADHDHQVVYMNPQAEAALGKALVQVSGRTIHTCHQCPWKVEEVLKGVSPEKPFRQEVKVGPRWLAITASPILSDAREFIGSVMVVSDITARREAEATIQQQNQELMARQSRIDLQMDLARNIQKALMPSPEVQFHGVTTRFWNRQSQVVGGDFGIVSPDQQGGWIILGDVMGKGVAASQFVPLMHGFVADELRATLSPGALLQSLNQRLTRFIRERFTLFVTAAAVRIDPARRQAVVATAGQEGLFRTHSLQEPGAGDSGTPSGAFEEIRLGGTFPLGLQPEPTYPETEIDLAPGDTFLLMSDGVTELDKRTAGGHPSGWMARLLGQGTATASEPLAVFTEYLLRYPAPDDQTLISFRLG